MQWVSEPTQHHLQSIEDKCSKTFAGTSKLGLIQDNACDGGSNSSAQYPFHYRISMSFQIGSRTVGKHCPCFIIAEIGQNHQGDIDLAKRMILQAKQCGADCVKFQKSHLPAKFTQASLARPYSGPNSWGPTYGAHKDHLEFNLMQYRELQSYANEVGILFTASAMDIVSLNEIHQLGVPFIKIGSGDANNIPLLQQAADLKTIPLVISTGMQTEQMISRIVETMAKRRGSSLNIALLHCVSSYPTPCDQVGLRMIARFQDMFPDIVIGYSGHERGVLLSLAAVAMGAKVLERHVTLDTAQKGTDHKLSLTPIEFSKLISNIRQLEVSLEIQPLPISPSDETILKVLSQINPLSDEDIENMLMALRNQTERILMTCEHECFEKLGKSLVYALNLKKGQLLTENDVCFKVCHPKGLLDEDYDRVIGARLSEDVSYEMPVMWTHLDCNIVQDVYNQKV